MLKFYHSTKLEILADRLLEKFENHRPENPLAPEIFVVQNHGIGQWLSLYMARQEGIAANLKFEFPSERIWSLIRRLDPDIPETLPSDRGPMTWSLMTLLQDEEILSEFENLRYYIREEDPVQRSVRTWKLASRIADIFDQYLVYRPELILKWEKGELKYNSQAEIWQAKLWKKLTGHWSENYDGKCLHRAQLQKKLLEAIDRDEFDSEELPNRVSIFGVSNMPPVFTEIMVKFSELIDIHFYQLTIDPEITESEDFKNPLLQSLGIEGAKFTSHFSRYAEKNVYESKDIESSNQESIFNKIQADLKRDKAFSGGSQATPALDSSIQVHSCHSPMREVEVLYDQLLAILDENPEITPDDILIMTPDIETYAPMIEAVFETPDEGQPKIPYSIADRGIEGAHPAVQTFLKILDLCESRFKVTDVLDLLDASPIQDAFGFSDDDLNRLESWIRDNRVRWGIDGVFKQKMNVPQSDSFTWKSGLNRMMLGYVMRPDDDRLHNGIFPYDEIETSDDAQLAGRFSRFLHLLFEISRQVGDSKTPENWVKNLGRIPDNFLPDTREYFWEISQIREALDQLRKHAELGSFDRQIPFRIVRSWLREQLEERTTGGGRIGRGVTFSSLMPMRSIPFKMIGIIGMNEDAFPRTKIPVEFDLMNVQPEPGDPVQSEEDRYLFLENILSARSHLYFSYVGQSNMQDTEFPPSVVLREFLDYLEEYYGLESEKLVKKHRLQAFSIDYFKDEGFFSYSQTQKNICQQLVDDTASPPRFMIGDLPAPDEEWKNLSVNDLIAFFQHSTKYLLQARLGINLYEDNVLSEDREPFALYGLDNYIVGQELLDRFVKEKPLNRYEQILQSRDMLPGGWSGEQAFDQRAHEVEEFGSKITSILNREPLEDCEADIAIDDFRLVGKLTNIYEDAMIFYKFGRMYPKDLIDLWIRHLTFQLVKPNSHPGFSRLFTCDKFEPFAEYRLSPIDDTRPILKQLLQMYWQGLHHCIYFFPQSSHAFGEEVCSKDGEPRSGLNKAASKWIRDYSSWPGEGEDAYNKVMLGTKNPIRTERFQQVSKQFWASFFEVLNQGAE